MTLIVILFPRQLEKPFPWAGLKYGCLRFSSFPRLFRRAVMRCPEF